MSVTSGSQAYHITLNHRISEETQLQAEEKWILDALSKIKAQRNCLQIERLQLEAMKSQLKNSTSKNIAEEAKMVKPAKAPTTFSISMALPKPQSERAPVVLSTPNRKLMEEEASCNTEALELGVGGSMFNMNPVQQFSMDEYDEDEEEMENVDELHLDMNMFMNCAQQQ